MRVLDISKFEDAVVIHFDTEIARINAYTLASSLVAIADAAKAANADLNPGYDIEIVVEALGPGSFRAKIRANYTKANNLFSKHVLLNLVLVAVLTHFLDQALWPDKRPQIQIMTDEVIFEQGDDRIIVPRNVYNATRQIEKLPKVKQAVTRIAASIAADDKIQGVSFVSEMSSPTPEVIARREGLIAIAAGPIDETPDRTIEEQCELQIVKAILEKGNRKWEFVWRGERITAPVLDQRFYERFSAHRITIAPGDSLSVRLAMKQKCDPNIGIYTNTGFEVLEVISHNPKVVTAPLPGMSSDDGPSRD